MININININKVKNNLAAGKTLGSCWWSDSPPRRPKLNFENA